mmetsp:Transcript_42279/g.95508  ORF Transcript_42279/g.95508 Transcript_42279/m.95508 type:complete len:228 (-) Transcript_42279:199-882(-)
MHATFLGLGLLTLHLRRTLTEGVPWRSTQPRVLDILVLVLDVNSLQLLVRCLRLRDHRNRSLPPGSGAPRRRSRCCCDGSARRRSRCCCVGVGVGVGVRPEEVIELREQPRAVRRLQSLRLVDLVEDRLDGCRLHRWLRLKQELPPQAALQESSVLDRRRGDDHGKVLILLFLLLCWRSWRSDRRFEGLAAPPLEVLQALRVRQSQEGVLSLGGWCCGLGLGPSFWH